MVIITGKLAPKGKVYIYGDSPKNWEQIATAWETVTKTWENWT